MLLEKPSEWASSVMLILSFSNAFLANSSFCKVIYSAGVIPTSSLNFTLYIVENNLVTGDKMPTENEVNQMIGAGLSTESTFYRFRSYIITTVAVRGIFMNDYYPFVNEPLPYAYNALRPYIDAETMYIHHNKYLQAYIDNLNEIMEQNPYMQQYSLVQMLSNTSLIPPELKVSIGDNAGGVFNHRMYFDILCTDRNEIEDGILKVLLVQSFGSVEQFTREFKDAALSVFGSGYAWLTYNKGRLYIFTMADENTPFQMGFVPILLVDMWEHAYFLQNLNRREDYLDSFMHVIDWEKVETNLMNANPVFESNGILIDYNEPAN